MVEAFFEFRFRSREIWFRILIVVYVDFLSVSTSQVQTVTLCFFVYCMMKLMFFHDSCDLLRFSFIAIFVSCIVCHTFYLQSVLLAFS